MLHLQFVINLPTIEFSKKKKKKISQQNNNKKSHIITILSESQSYSKCKNISCAISYDKGNLNIEFNINQMAKPKKI